MPTKHTKVGLCIATMAFVLGGAARAEACSATQTQVYKSAKTAWCVEKSVIAKYGAFPASFYSYGDSVIDELVTLFNVPAAGLYTFEASTPTGGAHTGSECCGLGVTVTGDAFYNDGYGVKGFWGYLLALHETINDWTGQVTGGWPTDFWADHISAFPNSMDWHVMGTLGEKLKDGNLTAASVAQKKRFYPGGDSADPRVVAFDEIFALPGYDYAGFGRVFRYIEGDKLSWDRLGVPNPDPLRTEYTIAYLSLGARSTVTAILQKANVGNGVSDGKGDKPYTVDSAHIDAIANAHCAIAAAGAQGVDVTADRASLDSGRYASVTAAGKCGVGCPSECGCKSSSDRCVAPWLADSVTADAGPDLGVDAADSAPATDVGDTGNPDTASTTEDSALVAPDAPLADAALDDGGASDGDASPAGCSCRVTSDRTDEHRASAWLVVSASVIIVFGRARARRRPRR